LAVATFAALAGTALAVPIVYPTPGYIVSGDGDTLLGLTTTSSGLRPTRWVFPAGPTQIVPISVSSLGNGISFNGQHIVGQTMPSSTATPFRWTVSGGLTPLHLLFGGSTGIAYGTSADGNASVGVSSSSNGARAVRWNNLGVPLSLGTLPAGTISSAYGISPNGFYVVGDSGVNASNTKHAFRWNNPVGPMQSLGTLSGGTFSKAVAVSDNGIATGYANDTNGNLRPFRYKFSWGFMENLGNIVPGATNASLLSTGISGNGSVIVGQSLDTSFGDRAFIWMSSTGVLDLKTYVASLGGDVTGWEFTGAFGISSNGRTISGSGSLNGASTNFVIKNFCHPPGAEWYRNTSEAVEICADPAWPTGSGTALPGATASLTIESEGAGPPTYAWFVNVGAPNGTPPQPIIGPVFSDLQSGLTFSVEGWTTPTITISNLRPSPAVPPEVWVRPDIFYPFDPCALFPVSPHWRQLRVSATCAPAACSAADIAGGGLAGLTPDGIVDGTDFITFINSFSTGEVAIDALADIAGGGIDGLQPDGIIDGNDFIAFINAFATGC